MRRTVAKEIASSFELHFSLPVERKRLALRSRFKKSLERDDYKVNKSLVKLQI